MAAAPVGLPIGLQLYSVRDLLPKDFDGTLRQLGATGYREVEAAGYYDKTAADFRNAMEQAGLRCISTHHPLNVLRPQLDQLIEYAQALGLEYMICSSPGGVHRDPTVKTGDLTLDDWRWVAGEFNRIGEKVKAAGMTFGYHNHGPEFATENGVVCLRRTAAPYRSEARGLRDGLRMGIRRRAQSGGLPEQDARALSRCCM